MEVTLREIDKSNWRECIKLKVREDQQNFVASNVFSIAQSKVEPYCIPLAIHDGDTMVGFTMYALDPADGHYWIVRLMIDEKHQGKGYGKAAMLALLDRLKEFPDCDEVRLSYVPENLDAERLYLGLGFEKTGLVEDGENILRYPIQRESS